MAAEASPGPAAGPVLAFDVGMRRVGVAVGEIGLGIAHPLDTIDAQDVEARFERIAALVREWQPVLMVVGLPVHGDGRPHELEPVVRRFARRLEGRFGVPVRLVDETLSSHEATRQLAARRMDVARRRALVDRFAAREILQTWFEEGHGAAA